MTAQAHERAVPCPPDLPPDCTNEELLAWVKQHYFTREELEEAERVCAASGYETAIAYLAGLGQESLRDSAENEPPRLFITIPGGKVLVTLPGTPAFSLRCALTLGIGELARLIFPTRASSSTPSPASFPERGMASLWEGLEVGREPQPSPVITRKTPAPEVAKKEKHHAKKLKYDELPVRVGIPGSGKYWHTVPGWVVRDRGLAYVIEEQRSGQSYTVSFVHSGSNWVLASFSIPRVDDLTHTRIRQLMEVVVNLTDWNQGIQKVLKEKQGRYRLGQWSSQIEGIWRQQEREALFPLTEAVVAGGPA